jgi:hypothetical protein
MVDDRRDGRGEPEKQAHLDGDQDHGKDDPGQGDDQSELVVKEILAGYGCYHCGPGVLVDGYIK